MPATGKVFHKVEKHHVDKYRDNFNQHQKAGTLKFDRPSEIFDKEQVAALLDGGEVFRVIIGANEDGTIRTMISNGVEFLQKGSCC
jgi:hypothetical protein